jgi:16S rRNA (uracil1498-N3)-methyltransferase
VANLVSSFFIYGIDFQADSYFCPMNLFYTTDIRDDLAWFSDEEARHFLQVMRKREGDLLHFVDGKGTWYEGVVEETGKRHVVAKIFRREYRGSQRNFYLHLAIAPTKNMERFEWFLEKVTEIGIDEITPLECEHSERGKIRPDRLVKILVAAMKQSLHASLPRLNVLTDFKSFIRQFETTSTTTRFIAHCQAQNLPHLKDNCQPGKNVTILIGPEGDFSLAEIELANYMGFLSVSLGKARLRTETAGIAACHIVNLIND